ncbi:MAG: hypothetical protein SWH61_01870 [Thermodesulfobacteriota bacterium]|nr:hypothetical protein [Thermodesulfobacteriota bacterium]
MILHGAAAFEPIGSSDEAIQVIREAFGNQAGKRLAGALQKVADMVDGFVNLMGFRTAGGVVRDIESGPVTRRPAFKDWFGDWEAAQAYRKVQNMVPVVINTDDFVRFQAVQKTCKQRAPVTNTADGSTIVFVNNTFGKLASHRSKNLLFRAIPHPLGIVQQAVPIYFESDRRGYNRSNVVAYQNYLSKVSIDETPYWARITVREVRKADGGSEFHNMFLSPIETTKAGKDGRSDIRKPGTVNASLVEKN